MEGNYSVQVEKFTKRHFIKNFEKKYKLHWNVTWKAIREQLERLDRLVLTKDRADIICTNDDLKIVKVKFRVSGTNTSIKKSGNRCIVAWYEKKRIVSVLLVYHKSHLGGAHETAEWKKLVKKSYPDLKDLF